MGSFLKKLNGFSDFLENQNEKIKDKLAEVREKAAVEEEKKKATEEAIEKRAQEILADKRAEKELERKFNELESVPEEQRTDEASSLDTNAFSLYFPVIFNALKEKAGPAIVDVLSDVDRLTELTRSAYQALPMPVRLVVKEQTFIEWVVSHQDSVIEKMKSQLVIEENAENGSVKLLPYASNKVDTLPLLDSNQNS